MVMPGAEPFFLKGDRGHTACLLIHGFASTPHEMRSIGQFLHAEGITVSAPLLPGHGTTVEDMSRTRWQNWVEHARRCYQDLSQTYPNPFIIGFSMGGLIAMHLASSTKPSGIVTACAPVFIRDWRVPLLPVLALFRQYEPPVPREKRPDDPGISYGQKPVACIRSLLQLQAEVRRDLPRINAPVLVIMAANDRTARPTDGEYVMSKIGSSDKGLVLLPNAGHMAMYSEDNALLCSSIVDFVLSHEHMPI